MTTPIRPRRAALAAVDSLVVSGAFADILICSILTRRDHQHAGAAAVVTRNIEDSAHLFDAFAHSGEAEAGVRVVSGEATAVVGQFEPNLMGFKGQGGLEACGARVLEG